MLTLIPFALIVVWLGPSGDPAAMPKFDKNRPSPHEVVVAEPATLILFATGMPFILAALFFRRRHPARIDSKMRADASFAPFASAPYSLLWAGRRPPRRL